MSTIIPDDGPDAPEAIETEWVLDNCDEARAALIAIERAAALEGRSNARQMAAARRHIQGLIAAALEMQR